MNLDLERPSQVDFPGIAVPEFHPRRRTMLLELWLPKDKRRRLEALNTVWTTLRHTRVSDLCSGENPSHVPVRKV